MSRPPSRTMVAWAPGPERCMTSSSQCHFSMPPGKASLSAESSAGRISRMDDLLVFTSMVRSLMRETLPQGTREFFSSRPVLSPGDLTRCAKLADVKRGRPMNHRRILASTLVLLLVFYAVAPAVAQAPRPAPAQFPGIADPKLFEESLKAAAEAVKQYGTRDTAADVARVNRIAYELAQQSEFQKFPFTFGIVNMPEPNAFALPAGQIFITTGMLDLGLDDDMLANVLGHEIGHVVHEHAIHMQRRQTLMTVLGNLLVAGVALGESRGGSHLPSAQAPYDPRVGYADPNGNLIQGAAAASLVVSELLLRSYSRDNEDEADKEGQSLAAAAGYSPDGARRLWDLMNSRAPQLKAYGYWQTHPFSDVRQRAAEARKGTWTVQARKSADDYRKRTQAVLATYLRH